MSHSGDMTKARHSQDQSRLLHMPGEIRNLIWGAVTPRREFYEADGLDCVALQRTHPAQQSGLLRACRQTHDEASGVKTKKTLDVGRPFLLLEPAMCAIPDDFDEIIHRSVTWGVKDISELKFHDLQASMVDGMITLKMFYSVVLFDRFNSIIVRKPDCQEKIKTVITKVVFEVEGPRNVEERHRRMKEYDTSYSYSYVEFLKEKSALEGRVSQQEFHRLLTEADKTWSSSSEEARSSAGCA